MRHFYIANSFIFKARKENIPLSPMKLQKLIYITYANYLQRYGEELFPDRFAAWRYGPVLEEIYYEYRDFGANSIDRYFVDSSKEAKKVSDSGEVGEIIGEVWEAFKNCSGSYLSVLTHQVGTAWRKAVENKKNYLDDAEIVNDGYKWQQQRI